MQPTIYRKGDVEKPVFTPAQAVNLRADGWTEVVVEQTEDPSIEASTEPQPDPDMGAGADQGADTAPE